eukprot:superscaffoldBa00001321_g10047
MVLLRYTRDQLLLLPNHRENPKQTAKLTNYESTPESDMSIEIRACLCSPKPGYGGDVHDSLVALEGFSLVRSNRNDNSGQDLSLNGRMAPGQQKTAAFYGCACNIVQHGCLMGVKESSIILLHQELNTLNIQSPCRNLVFP